MRPKGDSVGRADNRGALDICRNLDGVEAMNADCRLENAVAGSRRSRRQAKIETDVLSVRDVMALLGCQRTKVYEMFHAGDLAGFRVGKSIKVYRESVAAYRARTANTLAAGPVESRPSNPPRPARRPRPLLPPPRAGGYGHGL